MESTTKIPQDINSDNTYTDNTTPNASPSASPSKYTARRRLAIVGFFLVLAGWLTMMVNEWVSIGATVVGLIFSIVGVRIPPGPARNFAITAIVAASVLILVYALFASILIFI